MKNALLVFVFSFFSVLSISAQGRQGSYYDVGRKSYFFGFGVKGNVYVNQYSVQDIEVWKNPAFGANVFVGNWFSRYMGARLLFEGGKVKPYFQERTIMVDENYVLSRFDLLYDLTNRICGCMYDRFYNVIPYAGVSGAYVFKAENRPDNARKSTSLFFGVGLLNTFRMSSNLSAYLNLGLDLVDSKFDGSRSDRSDRKLNGIASATIGLKIDF